MITSSHSLTINNTRSLVQEVVSDVKQAVVSTMGPNGKLAFISIGPSVKVTKDGVTVAKAIQFDDPRKELINKIITEAAIKTDNDCGDGTTTTILYTAEFFELFCKYNSFREQKFIEWCAGIIVEHLQELAIKIKLDDPRLFDLALTSSNSDHELSGVVTELYRTSLDRYPTVELKEGITLEDKVVRSDGIPIKMHFSNPGFSKFGNGVETTFTNFIPVVIDDNVGRNGNVIQALISLICKYENPAKPVQIVLIARSVEQDVNSALIKHNQTNSNVTIACVNTNMGGSIGTLLMQDVAIMLGTQAFQTIEDATEVHVEPVVENLTVGNTRSLLSNITVKTKEALDARANAIENELANYELSDRYSVRARFNETRIRNLRGELVTIFVGGETNSDVKERTDRYEDVVKAVKSALVNGILPGVGSSLIKAGFNAVHEVLKELVNDPGAYPVNARDILRDIANGCCSTYNRLMEQSNVGIKAIEWYEGAYGLDPVCVSLATGEEGTADQLGIYDTALASITALKGGVQTAKILANGSSVILSNKIGTVSIIQK